MDMYIYGYHELDIGHHEHKMDMDITNMDNGHEHWIS